MYVAAFASLLAPPLRTRSPTRAAIDFEETHDDLLSAPYFILAQKLKRTLVYIQIPARRIVWGLETNKYSGRIW